MTEVTEVKLAGPMTVLQLGADLSCGVVESKLSIAFALHFFGADACQLFGVWQLSFEVEFGWAALCFVDASHHEWSVDVTVEEVDHHNFIDTG